MDNQTNQEKVEQIEKDIGRLGLKNDTQKTLFRAITANLKTYHQATAHVLAQEIMDLDKRKLNPVIKNCENMESLLTQIENMKFDDFPINNMTWEKKINHYPKIYGVLDEIIKSKKLKPKSKNNCMESMENLVVRCLILGKIDSFLHDESPEVQKTLLNNLLTGIKKSKTANGLVTYFLKSGIPKVIKIFKNKIEQFVNNEFQA